MSEYWKSTPKYWCKHCSLYVKDTKLERTNHEATPRHQGNLKRFLRDLHRGHESEAREKERAKNEVKRLQGLTSAGGGGVQPNSSSAFASGLSGGFGTGPSIRIPKPQAKNEDLKAKAAQLLEMGVEVPEEFRRELAVPGEWSVTSTKIISQGEDNKPVKLEAKALGVRKRVEEEKDEEEEIEKKRKKRGPLYRQYPGNEAEDHDLDALLSQVTAPKVNQEVKDEVLVKQEPGVEDKRNEAQAQPQPPTDESVDVKPDPKDAPGLTDIPSVGDASADATSKIKQEEGQASGGVVFKKRKAKNIRQK